MAKIIQFEATPEAKAEANKHLDNIHEILTDCKRRKQRELTIGFLCSSLGFMEIRKVLASEGYKLTFHRPKTNNPNHRYFTITSGGL